MAFRIEARIAFDDQDYVNAIVCETKEETDEIRTQWANRYPALTVTDLDAPVEATPEPTPTPTPTENF